MNRKNLLALVAGGLAIVLLLSIVLVGVIDDVWPWDGVTAYGRLIKGRTQATIGPKETTAPTETTEATSAQPDGEEETPQKPTVGEVTQKPVPPTLPNDDPDDDIQSEVGGVVINPSGSTEGSTGEGNTDSNIKPTDEAADKELDASQIPGW